MDDYQRAVARWTTSVRKRDMPALKAGQVAVVTGGAAGIGFALAEALSRKGLRVVLADLDPAALNKAVEQLRASGFTVIGVATDVSDPSSVKSLRQQVVASFGAVDLLCNNAGIHNPLDPVWTLDMARWRRLFEINYWGVAYGIQEFVPLFLAQGSGHVLNTASLSGFTAVPGSGDYGSSKHAVVALSEILRADLDLANGSAIGVTVVCPGFVKTAMGDRALERMLNYKFLDYRTPSGSGPNLSASLEPSQVAAAAIEGVENGAMYVMPTAGSRDRLLSRIQPILDEIGDR